MQVMKQQVSEVTVLLHEKQGGRRATCADIPPPGIKNNLGSLVQEMYYAMQTRQPEVHGIHKQSVLKHFS